MDRDTELMLTLSPIIPTLVIFITGISLTPKHPDSAVNILLATLPKSLISRNIRKVSAGQHETTLIVLNRAVSGDKRGRLIFALFMILGLLLYGSLESFTSAGVAKYQNGCPTPFSSKWYCTHKGKKFSCSVNTTDVKDTFGCSEIQCAKLDINISIGMAAALAYLKISFYVTVAMSQLILYVKTRVNGKYRRCASILLIVLLASCVIVGLFIFGRLLCLDTSWFIRGPMAVWVSVLCATYLCASSIDLKKENTVIAIVKKKSEAPENYIFNL